MEASSLPSFNPGDYDAIWESDTVDMSPLDPVRTDFSEGPAEMKAKHIGDLFPASMNGMPSGVFVDFFRTDRNGVEKGLVQIDLRYM